MVVASEPADHGLGRSRGGLTTKLHLAVEQGQKPILIVITAGQRGDSPQFEVVQGRIRVARLRPGRPRVRPRRVRPDKAYASRKNRACLRRRGIRGTVPDKVDQARNRKKRGSHGGRPPGGEDAGALRRQQSGRLRHELLRHAVTTEQRSWLGAP
ncbi:transposase [Streptomyces sp. ISL-11]|uniref:transposase n=1 Tax=Streptomyces sp. ISL-11 TaxID=2819174 RepID=UPI0027E4AEC2|nr:transposase [Streptomyces sp. ISL-11]